MEKLHTTTTYRITVAYDGTDFAGWQVQKHAPSVTGCLQDTFYAIFGSRITVVGASRTDAGVHAQGQVARFVTQTGISTAQILKAWNARLPSSVQIIDITPIDKNFHPCRGVLQKTYTYTLYTKRPLPHEARYGWYYGFMHQVDIKKFEQFLSIYQGTHDFGSFCKIEDPNVTSLRTINEIGLAQSQCGKRLIITIKGKGFARFQIRRMIGYALDLARRPGSSAVDLQKILDNPNPEQTLVKAEARGLCLMHIQYDPTVTLPTRAPKDTPAACQD